METLRQLPSQIREYYSDVIAVCLGIFLCYILFLSLDRREILRLIPEESMIIPPEVKAGQPIEIRWGAQEFRACDGYIVRRIIDSSGRVYEYARIEAVYRQLLVTERRSFARSMTLPTSMALGDAYYSPIAVRWCNFMQKWFFPIREQLPQIRFKVVG